MYQGLRVQPRHLGQVSDGGNPRCEGVGQTRAPSPLLLAPPRTPPPHSLRLLPPLPSRQCHPSRWPSGLVFLLGFFYVDLRKAQQFPCSTRAPKQGSYPFHPKTQPFWTLKIPPPTFLCFPFKLLLKSNLPTALLRYNQHMKNVVLLYTFKVYN